jgi:archaellum biogenesis ATPase FlaH
MQNLAFRYAIEEDTDQPGFCSGIGQYHSINNLKDPQPYLTITGSEIEAMAENPQAVEKAAARWAIPSTTPSRAHKIQREHGQFGAAWLDIDENPAGLEHVIDTIRKTLPETKFIAYTTKSATPENQKCRVIIPFGSECPGADFVLVQKITNNRLEKAGIIPDRKTEAAGQICYLPNRGEFYQYHIEQGKDLDWQGVFSDELAAERERIKEAEIALAERREQARRKASQRMSTGSTSPIDAYNQAYQIEDCLLVYGYQQHGTRYLSPNSSSGSPGVSIKDGKWISSHESDRETVGPFGDAFDLFCYYEHRGNRTAALKAAGEMFTIDGETINLANHRGYREAQAPPRNGQTHYTAEDLSAIPAPAKVNPENLLEAFVVTEEYVSKLGKEEFLYDDLLIKSHVVTVIAMPGGAKTTYFYYRVAPELAKKKLKIWYIDADSPASDHKRMKATADKYGFKFINPDVNAGTTMDGLLKTLRDIADSHVDLTGWVFIIDTLKKVADLMSKGSVKNFYQLARKLANLGATVVLLGHANKYRDKEGNLVFEGTGDVRSDTDELIYFERKTNSGGGIDVTTVVDPDKGAKVRGIFNPISFHVSESREITHYNDVLPVIDRKITATPKATDDDIIDAAKKYLFERNEPVVQRQLVQHTADMTGTGMERTRQVLVQNSEPRDGLALAGLPFLYSVGDKNAHFYELPK